MAKKATAPCKKTMGLGVCLFFKMALRRMLPKRPASKRKIIPTTNIYAPFKIK
jgi:hypothetical protein